MFKQLNEGIAHSEMRDLIWMIGGNLLARQLWENHDIVSSFWGTKNIMKT